MMPSYWDKDLLRKQLDLLVIGAGITGLSTALEFKKLMPEASILVVERGIFPYGASTRNAGFACFGSISELAEDLEAEDHAKVMQRTRLRFEGILQLKHDFDAEQIDYEDTGNFEFFSSDSSFDHFASRIEEFNDLMDAMHPGCRPYYLADHKRRLIGNRAEAVLHSGKLNRELQRRARALGIELWFGCSAHSIEEGLVHIDGLKLRAERIAVCSNGFASQLLPELEISPARGTIMVSKPMAEQPWIGGFHHDRGYYYFRHLPGNRLLIGGARNTAYEEETTTEMQINPKIRHELLDFANRYLLRDASFEIEEEWAGIMGFTKSKSPVVQKISEGIFVGAGLSGIGVATGISVGQQLARLMSH